MQREKDDMRTARPCPICGKPASFAERPFCSRHCAEIDLHRWLSDAYRVPGEVAPSDEAESAPPKPGQK